jgi:eukaryotic-like serine/threonine-protein kinase
MEFIKFLKSKLFLTHLAYAIGGTIVFVLLVSILLRWYTHHGEAFSVPDFQEMTMQEVERVTKARDLRYEIIDSVFVNDQPGGTVVEQNPPPGFKVKRKRRIFLVINANAPEQVMMPNVVGVSLRQAKAIVESGGLIVGRLQYVPDIAVNYVLEQRYSGKVITAGTMITKGSAVDLVLGMGLSQERALAPDIVGLSYFQAQDRLVQSFLNFGAVIFDNSVLTRSDSITAKVWKQRPEANPNNTINLGSAIDVWLTLDEDKIPVPQDTSNQTEEDLDEEY